MHWLLDLKKSLKRKVYINYTHARWSKTKSIWNAFLKFIWILRKISAKKQDLSISNAEARQLAVMKEVLYDQQQVMGEYEISYRYCLSSLFDFKVLCAVPGTFTFQNIYSLHVLLQLHDVLSKSDKMMAVVKDLFGDDPRVKINGSLIEY